VLKDEQAHARALGAWLTEPKPQVWFDAGHGERGWQDGVVLDRSTRMAHDRWHLFINGDAFVVGGRDARLLRHLADERQLDGRSCAQLSQDAQQALADWLEQGWLQPYQYSP
jgi:50S ribosomal protein L16 3-hydroxylase